MFGEGRGRLGEAASGIIPLASRLFLGLDPTQSAASADQTCLSQSRTLLERKVTLLMASWDSGQNDSTVPTSVCPPTFGAWENSACLWSCQGMTWGDVPSCTSPLSAGGVRNDPREATSSARRKHNCLMGNVGTLLAGLCALQRAPQSHLLQGVCQDTLCGDTLCGDTP